MLSVYKKKARVSLKWNTQGKHRNIVNLEEIEIKIHGASVELKNLNGKHLER